MVRKENSFLKKIKEPIVAPIQIAIFISIVIYTIISASHLFKDFPSIINLCIYLATYFFIMILKLKIGDYGISKLITTIVEILTKDEPNEKKMDRLE